MGIKKHKVLPDPVWLYPIKSFPFRAIGIIFSYIFVIYYNFKILSRQSYVYLERFRFLN